MESLVSDDRPHPQVHLGHDALVGGAVERLEVLQTVDIVFVQSRKTPRPPVWLVLIGGPWSCSGSKWFGDLGTWGDEGRAHLRWGTGQWTL